MQNVFIYDVGTPGSVGQISRRISRVFLIGRVV